MVSLIYTPSALGPAALVLRVYIYQANHSCPCYNYIIMYTVLVEHTQSPKIARMLVEATQSLTGIIVTNKVRNKSLQQIELSCVYPVIKKLMMIHLNASGVLASSIRFVLRLVIAAGFNITFFAHHMLLEFLKHLPL